MSFYQFNADDAKRFGREQHIKYKTVGNELRFSRCPYCQNRTNDKDTFSISLDTGQFKCLRASCGAKGNMITLAHDFGFSLGRDVDEYYNSRKAFRSFRNFPRPVSKEPAVAYLEGRGISAEVTKDYGITTQNEHDNVLVFPFFDDAKQLQFVKYRKTDFDKDKDKSKEWCEANCKPILFGMDRCDSDQSKVLVLTEGQIDSLSVVEAFQGEVNAVSVPTGAKGFTWVPYCWDFLCQFDELIVFGDYERGSISLLEEMKRRFSGTVKHVRPKDYNDCKDANDLLRKYGKDAVVEAVENAVPVEDPRIKEVADIRRVNTADMERIGSGFTQVDAKLGGFYFGQLIIITGERGLGKSTLASQFMTRALQQGHKVFAYSGELQDFIFKEWVERQIAGAENINAKKDGTGFCDYRINYQVAGDIENWYRGRFYCYDNSAVNDENEDLLETVGKAFKQYECRVVFIDNLMTAIDDNMTSDIYRQQTKFVRKLAEMAKQYNIIIFLVVHPRKSQGYTKSFQNDDVAGSGNITNLADTILNYTKPKEDDGAPDPAERILQITKNRLHGRTDFKGIRLWFEESSKRVTEVQGRFDWELGWENHDFVEIEDEDDSWLPFGDDDNDSKLES